jgi:hypothetical protein
VHYERHLCPKAPAAPVRPTPCEGIEVFDDDDDGTHVEHCADCAAYARLVARVEALALKWEGPDGSAIVTRAERIAELRALLPDVSKGKETT